MDKEFKLSYIAFFVILLTSYGFFIFRRNPYIRPNSYFFCLCLLICLIVFQILFLKKRDYNKFLLFVEVIFVFFSFTFTQQSLYQTLLGRDPWHHFIVTEEIVSHSIIPYFGEFQSPYFKMPIFHLLSANGMLITNFPYKWVQYFLIGLPTILLLLFIAWLFSNRLFKNYEIPFLSIIFVVIADNVLDLAGKSIIPNSLGFAIVFLIIYFIIFFNHNKKIFALVIFLSIILVMTHTISFTILIFQILLLVIFSRIYKESIQFNFYFRFLIILIIIGILEWFFYSGLYFDSLLSTFKQLFIYGVDDVQQYSEKIPLSFSVIDVIKARIGMGLLTLIAVGGILLALKNNIRNFKVATTGIIAGSIILSYFTFLSPALSGISHRFWCYGEIIGAIFAAFFLYYFFIHFIQKSTFKPALTVVFFIFIFVLSFLLFSASVANDDNPLVPQYTLRTGWYDSELSAGYFIIENNPGIPISSDYDYYGKLNIIQSTHLSPNQQTPLLIATPRNFEEVERCNCIFVSRIKIFESRYFILGGVWSQNPQKPIGAKSFKIISNLKNNGNLVYSNPTTIITLHGA